MPNRRTFIQQLALISFGVSMPLSGKAMLKTDIPKNFNETDDLSLQKLGKYLNRFTPFITKQKNIDNFTSAYDLLSLFGSSPALGELILKKNSSNGNVFDINFWRHANVNEPDNSNPFRYKIKASVSCKDNILNTPKKWECKTMISERDESNSYMFTDHSWTGKNKNNKVIIDHGSYKNDFALTDDKLSWKWGLIHTVEKMRDENISQLDFQSLDELDRIYAHQKIRYIKDFDIHNDKHTFNYKLYFLTGDGILPTAYWVDQFCKTHFVITGIEAFVIKAL